LQRLIRLFQHYDEDMYFKKISNLYQLFDHLYEEIRRKNLIQPLLEEDWLTKGKNFMDKYYSEGISVTDVAEYVGMNRTYFSSTFTKEMGITTNRYIQKMVMDRAAHLLMESSKTITEIALSLYY